MITWPAAAADRAALLPIPVVLPLAGAVLAPLVARVRARAAAAVALSALAGSTAVLVMLAPDTFRGELVAQVLGHWGPLHGAVLGVTFMADPFGLTVALLSSLVGMVLIVATASELSGLGAKELGGFVCLFQLLLAGLIGASLTADSIDMFVWFEVVALASYGLCAFFLERPPALEAALKMMVLTNVAAFCVFVGAAMLYTHTGALSFGQLHAALARSTADPPPVAMIALALLVAGFAVKAGLMPFHGWLADAQMTAPGPASALFAGLMDNLGILCIVRFAYDVYDDAGGAVLVWLAVVGAISAVFGALLALAQDDLKRLLAYDTISQMGVLAVGFASSSSTGVAGAVYHLVDHGLFKTLLFLCAGSILHSTGRIRLSELGGLGRRRPVLAIAFVAGCAAIAGVPPMNGYVSIGLIHDALRHGHPALYATMLLAQVLTVAALGRAAYLAFFRRPPREQRPLSAPRAGMTTAFGLLAAGCVAFGVVPDAVLRHVAGPAATSLLSAGHYARAALAGHGQLPEADVSFSYFAPSELVTMASTVIAGLLVAAWYVRRTHEPVIVRALRRLHTGSVNDYVAFAAVGLVGTLAVLAW